MPQRTRVRAFRKGLGETGYVEGRARPAGKGGVVMADFYPLMAEAVSKLEKNTAETRQELFDRARVILVEQLRLREPSATEREIVADRFALKDAIRKIEAESPGDPVLHTGCDRPDAYKSEAALIQDQPQSPAKEQRRLSDEAAVSTANGRISCELFCSFSGRISRATFWLAQLCILPVYLFMLVWVVPVSPLPTAFPQGGISYSADWPAVAAPTGPSHDDDNPDDWQPVSSTRRQFTAMGEATIQGPEQTRARAARPGIEEIRQRPLY